MERGGANVAYLYDLNPGPPGSSGAPPPTAVQPVNGPNGGIVANAVLSAPVSTSSSNVAGIAAPGGIPPQDENYCLRWNDYEKKYAETFR